MNKQLIGLAAVVSVIVLLLASQTQGLSRVDAGGTKVRMLLAGSGSPTVVFETGGEGHLELWGIVPTEVSKFAKTISYDRAGNGLSEIAVRSRDGRHTAMELHTALQNANASPPYILVGHSVGGPYVRIFAGMYPDEVAGMVLIDPTQEEMLAWNQEHGFSSESRKECGSDNERDCGIVIREQAHESSVPAGIPVHLIHITWPSRVMPFRLEESLNSRIQLINEPIRQRFHKEWVEKIPGGQFTIAENSFHGTINFEEPELVIGAIRSVIEKSQRVRP